MVQQSDVQRQENPGQASGDRLHFTGSSNSQVTEPEASDLEGYYWMSKQEQNASSSSGRNESHNANWQASGDRLESKEDENVINLLSLGVKLLPDIGHED